MAEEAEIYFWVTHCFDSCGNLFLEIRSRFISNIAVIGNGYYLKNWPVFKIIDFKLYKLLLHLPII